jgi:hypothetical protein
MADRGALMEQALRQADVKAEEVAELVQEGSIFFRLLGKMLRREKELQTGLINQDLVSEEGRLRALKEQGKMVGRTELVDWIFDLVLEGAQDERPEQSD